MLLRPITSGVVNKDFTVKKAQTKENFQGETFKLSTTSKGS